MGNLLSAVVPPSQSESQSPKMLIPPVYNSHFPLAARTRPMESPYNWLFGKNPILRSIMDDNFEAAKHYRISLVALKLSLFSDFIVNVAGPLDQHSGERNVASAEYRFQSVTPNRGFGVLDICVSNTEPILLMRSSTFIADLGLQLFCIKPFLMKESEAKTVVGFQYCFPNLLSGASCTFHRDGYGGASETAWAVGMMGPLSVGVQYEPKFESKDEPLPNTLADWSFGISYGPNVPKGFSDLVPSCKFGLQLANNSQLIASFYQHITVQRQVFNPFERNEIVGITNYIDLGFEWQKSVDGDKYSNKIPDSTFQFAASWQANKNLLVKGKVGPLSSSIALAFKSWWEPAFTFTVSAIRDHTKSGTAFGFGLQVDNIHVYRKARYMRANSFYAMTPTPLEEILD